MEKFQYRAYIRTRALLRISPTEIIIIFFIFEAFKNSKIGRKTALKLSF
jgi:hypothetical protein